MRYVCECEVENSYEWMKFVYYQLKYTRVNPIQKQKQCVLTNF